MDAQDVVQGNPVTMRKMLVILSITVGQDANTPQSGRSPLDSHHHGFLAGHAGYVDKFVLFALIYHYSGSSLVLTTTKWARNERKSSIKAIHI